MLPCDWDSTGGGISVLPGLAAAQCAIHQDPMPTDCQEGAAGHRMARAEGPRRRRSDHGATVADREFLQVTRSGPTNRPVGERVGDWRERSTRAQDAHAQARRGDQQARRCMDCGFRSAIPGPRVAR